MALIFAQNNGYDKTKLNLLFVDRLAPLAVAIDVTH
jgi:hypothetical protein